MNEIRVVSWNVNGRNNVAEQMSFVDDLGWDVLLLQEVTIKTFPRFMAHASIPTGDFALAHLPERVADPKVKYGSAIFVNHGCALTGTTPMSDVPSPERTLWGCARVGDALLDVASLAAPPASTTWGPRKVDQILAYANKFKARTTPMVVGVDANAPRFDRIDPIKTEWWWDEEATVWGEAREHDLRDVFRDHLAGHPDELAAIVAARPDGPLAVTHLRGHRIPSRIDFIFASPDLDVVDARVIWKQAGTELSDHGLVWAKLRLLQRTTGLRRW